MDFQFSAPHTALWRGYIGTWAIEHDRLYLKSLEGTILSEKSGLEDVGLERIFLAFQMGYLHIGLVGSSGARKVHF